MAIPVHELSACPPSIDELLPDVAQKHQQLDENIVRIDDTAEIAGAMIAYSYYRVRRPIDDRPVVISPGFAGIKPAYEGLGQALANAGREAITIRPVRRQRWTSSVSPVHLLRPLRLPSQAVWAVMRDVRDNYGVDQYDVLAHSMGGATIMGVVNKKPDYVRAVNLAGSVGLDEHTPWSLGRKLPAAAYEIATSMLKLDLDRKRAARHILHYSLQNPFRTVTEALAVSNCDIRADVKLARDRGIRFGRLQFRNDPFFPLADISEEAKSAVDLYQEFPGAEAGHLTPLLQPERVARINQAMLEKMLAIGS